MLVRVLDHDDGGVDHRADGDGDAAEAHDGRVDAERVHGDERHQHADRQHDDGDQRAADVQQEDDADESDDDALLDQRALQRLDGAMDQVGAVVDGDDAHVLGQARRDLLDLLLDVGDDVERVLAVALHDDAADHLALAVELGRGRAARPAPSSMRATSRSSTGVRPSALEDDLLEVGDAPQVAAAAHHVLGLGHLDDAAADVAVVACGSPR